MYISYISNCCDKIPAKKELEGGKVYFGCSWRRCRPSHQQGHGSRQRRLDDPTVSEFRTDSMNMKWGQERKPGDLTWKARFLQQALLHKLLSSYQIMAPADNHGFKHTSLWGRFHSNHCVTLVYSTWNRYWARSIFLAEKHANSKNKTFAKDKQFIHHAVKTMNRGGQASRLPFRYGYGWRSRWFGESGRLDELIWVLHVLNQMPWFSTGHILREQ